MRLIDADALIKRWNEMTSRGRTEFDQEIMLSQTIKAEPNSCKYWDSESHFCALHRPQAEPKYGRWKRTKAYPNIIFCDECGEPFEKSNSNDKWNYCPNCGAKMR